MILSANDCEDPSGMSLNLHYHHTAGPDDYAMGDSNRKKTVAIVGGASDSPAFQTNMFIDITPL